MIGSRTTSPSLVGDNKPTGFGTPCGNDPIPLVGDNQPTGLDNPLWNEYPRCFPRFSTIDVDVEIMTMPFRHVDMVEVEIIVLTLRS